MKLKLKYHNILGYIVIHAIFDILDPQFFFINAQVNPFMHTITPG